MRVVKIILLATLAYAVAQPGQTGAAKNYFESYVLALEWQPSWSLDACPGGANPNAPLTRATDLQYEYWGWQKDAMVNISMGHGATLVTVNVGKSVSLDKLQAAFDADAGGHRTTLVCQPRKKERGCKLDQVWLGFEAEMPANPGHPRTPLVMPSHGVNTIRKIPSASTCDAYCGTTGVYIPEWKGCPVRK